jgi:dTDP-4-dehydrorhamnose 3,5-epimerase
MAKIGVFDESRREEPGYRGRTFVVGEKSPHALVIPPKLWHGLTAVGSQPCGLLYYVTKTYDPMNPDEDRIPHDSFQNFCWDIEHK